MLVGFAECCGFGQKGARENSQTSLNASPNSPRTLKIVRMVCIDWKPGDVISKVLCYCWVVLPNRLRCPVTRCTPMSAQNLSQYGSHHTKLPNMNLSLAACLDGWSRDACDLFLSDRASWLFASMWKLSARARGRRCVVCAGASSERIGPIISTTQVARTTLFVCVIQCPCLRSVYF